MHPRRFDPRLLMYASFVPERRNDGGIGMRIRVGILAAGTIALLYTTTAEAGELAYDPESGIALYGAFLQY